MSIFASRKKLRLVQTRSFHVHFHLATLTVIYILSETKMRCHHSTGGGTGATRGIGAVIVRTILAQATRLVARNRPLVNFAISANLNKAKATVGRAR